jgi:hypothetical protein
MKKIIFVTTTKPFNDTFGFRQINAITSWALLPNIEKEIVILTEDDIIEKFDPSVSKKIKIVKDYERSDLSNIPTYRSLWNIGSDLAEDVEAYVCQINADIILTSSFSETFISIYEKIGDSKFGIFGQRTDWNCPKKIDFSDPYWEQKIIENETKNFILHEPCGIDFILGKKNILPDLPIFYVARMNYDRWLVANVIQNNEYSIDVTRTVMAIHQNHGYGHDGNKDFKEFEKDIKEELSTNKGLYPVANIDHSRHITEKDNEVITIKNRHNN